MEKKGTFTTILAAGGTILAWLPILAILLFGGIGFLQSGMLNFDYLIPAELFIVVLVGGLMLLWAAVRAKACRGIIGWSLLAAVIFLVGSQALAVATGVASGERDAAGFWWILVLSLLGLYVLAVLLIGIGGIRLLFKLKKSS
jgi:hypothetical protein